MDHVDPPGWREDLRLELHALGDPALVPARAMAVDRGRVVVDSGSETWSAPLSGRVHRGALMPVTGDFVAALPAGPVRAVLGRRRVIARRREDKRRPQVLAANVDLALVATSLNRELNPRRLARWLAITTRGHVRVVVLLTKADLVRDAETTRRALEAEVQTLAVSVVDGRGLNELRALLEPGHTAVLLGSSGVGKSTLLNTLLGEQRLATQPIRESDDRGRHTTVRREMVALPTGALLIDTPGLRAVAPPGEDEAAAPLAIDRAVLRRERRARERAATREFNREMRARRGSSRA